MAAAPSKPSPSNRPMDGTSESVTKGEPVSAVDAATKEQAPSSPAAAAEEPTPTYESVEASDIFLLAKSYLNDGKFEEALRVIEEGIKSTQELVKRTTNCSDEEACLHESQAPYHYLYGKSLGMS
jgi:hypothetical protein